MKDNSWFEIEKSAMAGNRDAIINLVSGFRTYRQSIDRLAKNRHRDGAVDGADVHTFLSEIASADDLHFGL